MLTRNQIKLLRALGSRKHRQKYHKFIAEGEKVVLEAIREWPDQIDMVVVDPEAGKEVIPLIPRHIPIYQVAAKTMEMISGMETPPGVLCLIDTAEMDQDGLADQDWILFLDGIKDPGNLGTIIRTADWFGLGAIVLGPGCADWMNPKVVQASMGSVFRVRCLELTLGQLTDALPDRKVLASDMEGEDVVGFPFPRVGILVLGSESHGVSNEAREKVDQRVTIKKDPRSRAESLNVATAAGILLNRVCARAML